MPTHRPRSLALRGMLALMACMLLLLAGVAQQRALAAQLIAGAGQLALCLPGAEPGESAPDGPLLHDCFDCCPGTQPTLPSAGAGKVVIQEWHIASTRFETTFAAGRAHASRPPSRGPPEPA